MDWIQDHMAETWLITAVALAALELVSMDLIFIMLAGGALVSMVVAILGGPVLLQVVAGLATAVGLLFFIRPNLVRRLHAGPELKVGAEALIGRRAVVLEELAHAVPGRVKIGGDVWSALPFDEDDRIEPGVQVDVVTIKGAIAYVVRTQSES
jgi:membrane protein implicated in regulation of membrane protease activity